MNVFLFWYNLGKIFHLATALEITLLLISTTKSRISVTIYILFCVFTRQEIRGWRTLAAVSHIGTAILSSAITTIVASIPLCLTVIQLFAKFGQILAINTAVSIFFTLTICIALLCIMGPVRFRASYKSSAIAFVVVAVVYVVGGLILYFISAKLVTIPGPAGQPLFS